MTKKKTPSERGGFRSTFDTLWDDLDFQRLSPLGKTVWHALKSRLGQYGIAVFYVETLPRIINASAENIEAALEELERPKPGKTLGWIVRDEHVFWMVNGLKFEPWLTIADPNQQTGTRRYLATLPKLPIIDRFLTYYGLAATASGDNTIDGGRGEGSPFPTGGGRGEGSRETDTDTETDTESETEMAPPIPGLPIGAARFVARFYGLASEERRQEVIGQLRAAISAKSIGARISKGVHAKARDLAHLEKCCLEVAADPPNKHDIAIVWVLKKLTDPVLDKKGVEATEGVSALTKAKELKERAYRNAKRKAAKPWVDDNPEKLEKLKADALAQIPAETSIGEIMRQEWILERIAETIAFPDFETWAAGEAAVA